MIAHLKLLRRLTMNFLNLNALRIRRKGNLKFRQKKCIYGTDIIMAFIDNNYG